MKSVERIELIEYTPQRFPRQRFTEQDMEKLWREHGKRIVIEAPGFKTDGQWQLTAQGWVGYIPVNPHLGFALMPKVPVANLFRMLDYAYDLGSFEMLDGLHCCETLQGFYERLANQLARQVLGRAKRGLYRTYMDQEEPLAFVRGRLDLGDMLRRPWETRLRCQYQDHVADITENQILLWTLHKILRSGLCSERVLSTVRKAYYAVHGQAVLRSCTAKECLKRLYNRLNEDYRPMHALCRFFLEQSGPSHEGGGYEMLPFVVDMNRLFELFVAEWLKKNLPQGYELRTQEKFDIGENGEISFAIDLVLYDVQQERVKCVLDTKYKTHTTPAPADIHQISFYALAKDCTEAILLYPTSEIEKFSGMAGNIRVQSMSFALDGDIEANGNKLLMQLLAV